MEASINEYLTRADWRVNANANQGYSLGGLILNVAGKVTANYWLSHVYPPEIGEAHRNGDIHIHDLDMLCGYCAGWSLRTLLHEGLNGVPGKVEAGPPRHMSSAVGQIVNFLGTLQNEWAGAQAFSSFDTYMAPFVRNDNLAYDEVRQCIQELVYNLNVPSRWGTQTPFTNLTFDWTCPDDLREQVPVIGGQEMPFTYGELQAEMDMINRAYIEVMTTGDAKGRVFTFPIPTYNITRGLPLGVRERAAAVRDDRQVRAALFPELRQLRARAQHGPLHVLPAAARPARAAQARQRPVRQRRADRQHRRGHRQLRAAGPPAPRRRDGLLRALDALLELGKQSLEVKRKLIQRLMDQGLFPYTKRYLGTLRNHFSTLGVNGINEMVRNFTGDADDITTECGHALALRLLDHVRERIVAFQEETGHLYNLEATPAEGTTYRFAARGPQALARDPAGRHRGAALLHQLVAAAGRLHRRPVRGAGAPGGAAVASTPAAPCCTCTWASACPAARPAAKLVRRALTRFRLPYITVTPTFSICPTHGYLAGEHAVLPEVRRGAARAQASRRRCPTTRCQPACRGDHTMTTCSVTQCHRRRQRADPARRRAPALRSLDPRDGLPPAGVQLQRRQEGRAQRAPVLYRVPLTAGRMTTRAAGRRPDAADHHRLSRAAGRRGVSARAARGAAAIARTPA